MQTKSAKAYRGLPLTGPPGGMVCQEHREADRAISDGGPGHRRSGRERRPRAGGRPGPGYFAVELAKLGPYRIVGLDISQSFVRMATDNARKAGVNVDFRHGNASSMPFDSDSFDFVYCRAAFKNFSEPIAAINEMYRVLKPGGTAVIFDLRKDASASEIDAAVDEMGLDRINAALTRWIFKHSLLKRAYVEEDFRRMASRTPFATCEIKSVSIGFEVSLYK